MDLLRVMDNPVGALSYLERYVNKGSPSGFTSQNGVSIPFSPSSNIRDFVLPCYSFQESELKSHNLDSLHSKYGISCQNGEFPFFIHPDMNHKFETSLNGKLKESNLRLKVSPTSSERTLSVLETNVNNSCYIKLHYDGIIGRIDRKLPYKKAISGIEITREISSDVIAGKSPKCFTFFPEDVSVSLNDGTWSYIVRDSKPLLHQQNTMLIPFFSLFSEDRFSPGSKLIFEQLVNESGRDPVELFSIIVSFIQKTYWYLVFEWGYIPELNAQNILLELDSDLNITRLVYRDLQGWEKDLTLRRKLGLSDSFMSHPYKCIEESDDNYYIRHSFSYDFKVGNYLFLELIRVVSKVFKISNNKLKEIIKSELDLVTNGYDINGFFNPWECWYYHENVLLTEERHYFRGNNLEYRRQLT